MAGVTPSSTHPPLPPTKEDDRLSWLRLLRSSRIGIASFYKLLNEAGSAQAALDALPQRAADKGVSNYRPCSATQARAELAAGQRHGAQLIAIGSALYPPLLAEINDPPPLLWVKGDIALLKRPLISMVGARNASSLGRRMAKKLARDLGEAGFCVVSGLARGIDAAAHEAALSSGTIAVMAGGIDIIYPTENKELAAQIMAQGLIVTDQPVGMRPHARHFPMRNRLISGMSSAVIVIEAAARSGSLITAREALDQGRDVLAVPGHPFDARASGCNMLLRDGAVLIRNAADVIEVVGEAPQLPVTPCNEASITPVFEDKGEGLPYSTIAQTDAVEYNEPDQIAASLADVPDLEQPDETAIPADIEPAPRLRATPEQYIAPAQNLTTELANLPTAKPSATLRATAALHSQILDRLSPSPMAEDQLIRDLGRKAGDVAPILVDLELDGRISRAPGGLLSLVN